MIGSGDKREELYHLNLSNKLACYAVAIKLSEEDHVASIDSCENFLHGRIILPPFQNECHFTFPI